MFNGMLKPYKGHRNKGIKGSSIMVIMGALIVLLNMAVSLGHGYTYALERASVSLGLGQEWVAGDPRPGEPGDLFNQLELRVKTGDTTLYNGKMSGLKKPVDVTQRIGSIAINQPLSMDYEVYLPGRETGNEFQGSYLVTRFIVLAKCTTKEGEEVPCTISMEPKETLFDLRNLNPGDSHRGELVMTVKVPDEYIEIPDEEIPGGPLPKTGEGANYLSAIGFTMVVIGFMMKSAKVKAQREKCES